VNLSIPNLRSRLVWITKVRSEGEWDIKRDSIWVSAFEEIPYYSQKYVFKYNDYYFTSEDLGNYIFGCTGHAIGFTLTGLKIGSSVIAQLEGTQDDDNDIEKFTLGYNDYEDFR
jgi:hypothetical protein